jgi:hypothetical protein
MSKNDANDANCTNDANDANDEDRIVKQFGKSNVNVNAKTSSTDNTEPLQFFNITDKIIDKIREDKYLIKIGFRELMAYATPIVFNLLVSAVGNEASFALNKPDNTTRSFILIL